MTRRAAAFFGFVLLCGGFAVAQPAPDSVYAPPALPTGNEGINQGAVHFDLGLSYETAYIYRGTQVFNIPGTSTTFNSFNASNLNLQIDSKLSFDLGKLPHPYVSVFANVANDDPISNFEEVRPSVGFDWTIKPIVVSSGYTSYLYPERDERETSEVFLQFSLDDQTLFGGKTYPVPYILGVYDVDKYHGFYVESGVKYRLAFDDLGITFTGIADVAYVAGYSADIDAKSGGTEAGFFTNANTTGGNVYGFQHYDIGLIGEYSLNKLFNFSDRYGEVSIRGDIYYTGSIDHDVNATSILWGGAGIEFKY